MLSPMINSQELEPDQPIVLQENEPDGDTFIDDFKHDCPPYMTIWLNIPPSPDARTIELVPGPPWLPAPIEITEDDLAPE